MLLRSSSTPVLGSLLSSIAESPSHGSSSTPIRHFPSNSFHHNNTRLSFHPSPTSLHLSTIVSCGSSPISPSVVADEFSDFNRIGICRAQSEGNLEGLVNSACDSNGNADFYNQNHPNKHISASHNRLMLETIPSFSFYNSRARCEEEEEEDDDDDESKLEEEEKEEEEVLESSEERVMAAMNGGQEFKTISKEVKVGDKMWNVGFGDEGGKEMFLAKGLGTDGGSMGGFGVGDSGGGGGGGGGEFINGVGTGGDGGGDKHEVEQYYKRMVEENPGKS